MPQVCKNTGAGTLVEISDSKEDLKKELGFGKNTILSVGRLVPNKGFVVHSSFTVCDGGGFEFVARTQTHARVHSTATTRKISDFSQQSIPK